MTFPRSIRWTAALTTSPTDERRSGGTETLRCAVRQELFAELPESRSSSRVWPLAIHVHFYFPERRLLL